MWNRSRVAGVPDYAKIPFDNGGAAPADRPYSPARLPARSPGLLAPYRKIVMSDRQIGQARKRCPSRPIRHDEPVLQGLARKAHCLRCHWMASGLGRILALIEIKSGIRFRRTIYETLSQWAVLSNCGLLSQCAARLVNLRGPTLRRGGEHARRMRSLLCADSARWLRRSSRCSGVVAGQVADFCEIERGVAWIPRVV